jgi:hypothetical protein
MVLPEVINVMNNMTDAYDVVVVGGGADLVAEETRRAVSANRESLSAAPERVSASVS